MCRPDGRHVFLKGKVQMITYLRNFTHPAGNTMTELKEAELNNFAAGAGEPRNSGGMFCTSTGECNMGTLNIFCC